MTVHRSKRLKREPVARSKRPRERGTRSPTLDSRMKAAGFSDDDSGQGNIDALRLKLARRIAMLINSWHGCPERLCRRYRGCMAPHGHCTNAPPVTASPEQVARTLAEVHRAVRAAAERRAAEDGLIAQGRGSARKPSMK